MEEKPLRVLLIEDSEVYRRLIQSQLEGVTRSITLETAGNLASGLERLSVGRVDAVLLDLMLPDSSGIDTLWKTLAHSPDTAIVVLTALDDEELALSAVKGGAQDYLGKEQVTGEMIVRSIRYAIERKSLLTRLTDSVAELQRNNQDLEQFAAAAERKLQPPIQLVGETCQFLLQNYSSRLDEAARKRIARSQDELTRMRRLVEDFLTYIRVAVHKTSGQSAADCEAVLAEVMAKLGCAMPQGAKVTHDRLPTVPVERSLVSLVFQNLLSNAIRYRREDVALEFHLGVEKDADMWVFIARDNGKGIAPEYPEQIFEIFSGPNADVGRGIGLAICQRIVINNGGRIWVESNLGEGSSFYFTLPVKRER